jgi:hypothetical protein
MCLQDRGTENAYPGPERVTVSLHPSAFDAIAVNALAISIAANEVARPTA